ncbi:mCG147640 [Mus musculus]|nr:mCG147640 [Mus musculus]
MDNSKTTHRQVHPSESEDSPKLHPWGSLYAELHGQDSCSLFQVAGFEEESAPPCNSFTVFIILGICVSFCLFWALSLPHSLLGSKGVWAELF